MTDRRYGVRPGAGANEMVEHAINAAAAPQPVEGAAVEFERIVQPPGNLMVCEGQFWLGGQ